MAKKAHAIPKGFHSVTPYLAVQDVAQAIDFYKRAFGAEEVMRMDGPQGKVSHGEIKIGDSIVMIAEEGPSGGPRSPQSLGGSTVSVVLYAKTSIRFSSRPCPREPKNSSLSRTCFGAIATAG